MILSVNITIRTRIQTPILQGPAKCYKAVLQRTAVITESHESGGVKWIKGKLLSRLGVPPRCLKLCQLTFACNVLQVDVWKLPYVSGGSRYGYSEGQQGEIYWDVICLNLLLLLDPKETRVRRQCVCAPVYCGKVDKLVMKCDISYNRASIDQLNIAGCPRRIWSQLLWQYILCRTNYVTSMLRNTF